MHTTRKIFFFFLLSILSLSVFAQDYSSRFYRPSREWQEPEGVNYQWHTLEVGAKDTITYAEFVPVEKPIGTILYYHGAGGNISRYIPLVQPMVAAGYRVFMADFRGYGKSTGTPNHVNVARDAQRMFDVVVKRKDVRRKDLIVYGASLGSQVATKISQDNPKKVDALVLDGPMTSFTEVALEYSPKEHHGQIKMFVTSPYSAKEGVAEIEDIPLLVIHSKEDEAIPFWMGEAVYEAKAGEKELWVYEGEHIQAPVLYTQELISRIDGMLR